MIARKQAKSLISKAKPDPAAEPPGLRERKRQQTRERLTRAAMALFLERGFEATTLDDIAAAADISRRSFFHYFAVQGRRGFRLAGGEHSGADRRGRRAARRRIDVHGRGERDFRDGPAARSPAKRSRWRGSSATIRPCRRAIRSNTRSWSARWRRRSAKRAGHKTEKLQARLVAMIATGAMRIGGELWAAEGAREKPEALAKRTFAAIRAILN